ncbi:hypothetical protein PIB30_088831 [Stylosanthes scabra]|uniref:Uncharacterized protein n=1 Tax=Stylosanthes scabra TaxID=79078 RepID=A0ABU6WTR5_9FABA|nr:hypothetical protein [Stylosanthes scabra]
MVLQEDNNDNEDEFETNYKVADANKDDPVVYNPLVSYASQDPFAVPPYMCALDLEAMHAPEFSEYVNIGVATPEDGEFQVGMEYISRESVISAIKHYTEV